VYLKNHPSNNQLVINKFERSGMDVRSIDKFDDVEKIIRDEKCQYFYAIKGSHRDQVMPHVEGCKNLIHMTGHEPLRFAFGDVFAYVSETLNEVMNGQNSVNGKVVPHIVQLPDVDGDFRKEWGIPDDHFVIGRTGGLDTFNIRFVHDCIKYILTNRNDIWFCLQNTPEIVDHPRLIRVPVMADPKEKVKYINTCDAFLHAHNIGETFGIAVGEFASKNKAILIGLFHGHDKVPHHHIKTLGSNAIIYQNPNELLTFLSTMNKDWIKKQNKNWNCYQEYTPEKVMPIFDKVFLS
jgi:hypothetical protein